MHKSSAHHNMGSMDSTWQIQPRACIYTPRTGIYLLLPPASAVKVIELVLSVCPPVHLSVFLSARCLLVGSLRHVTSPLYVASWNDVSRVKGLWNPRRGRCINTGAFSSRSTVTGGFDQFLNSPLSANYSCFAADSFTQDIHSFPTLLISPSPMHQQLHSDTFL